MAQRWSTSLPRRGSRVRSPSRALMNKRTIPNGIVLLFSSPARARKFDVYAPLRSAQSEVPRTSCAVSHFFLIAIPASGRTVGDIIYRGLYFSKMMNGKVTGDFPILFSILLLYVTCHFHLLLLLFHPIHHFHTFLIMSCFQPYDIPDGWLL